MIQGWRISRRTMLRGMGAAMSLPLLDVMTPPARRVAAATTAPRRLAYLYFPNGIPGGSWEPQETGPNGELRALCKWMKPLEPYMRDILIPKNMWTPHGNGHGAGTATWLTGSGYDRNKISGGGLSVDQLAAKHVGGETLLPSLELSLKGEGFFSNDLPRNALSWTAPGRPASREYEPRVIFDRMFRTEEGGMDRSVLDAVLEDAKRMKGKVSIADKRKLDEYLDSVRAIERRLDFAGAQSKRAIQDARLTDSLTRSAPGIPTDHGEYVRVMMDMMVLAFWADATRVSTFMLDHGQSNRYFNFIEGVQGTWHALSHYRDASGNTEDDDGITSWDSVETKRDMFGNVVRWHNEQVAYLIGRLKDIQEEEGSLLDNCMIVYGSSLSDGHEHGEEDLPLIVAGRGGGTIATGRQVAYREQTSMSNLHLSLLQRMGLPIEEFGDSTGPMEELDA